MRRRPPSRGPGLYSQTARALNSRAGRDASSPGSVSTGRVSGGACAVLKAARASLSLARYVVASPPRSAASASIRRASTPEATTTALSLEFQRVGEDTLAKMLSNECPTTKVGSLGSADPLELEG